jgi:hypothetical protein
MTDNKFFFYVVVDVNDRGRAVQRRESLLVEADSGFVEKAMGEKGCELQEFIGIGGPGTMYRHRPKKESQDLHSKNNGGYREQRFARGESTLFHFHFHFHFHFFFFLGERRR